MQDLDTPIKAYDIRGTYPDQLDEPTANAAGAHSSGSSAATPQPTPSRSAGTCGPIAEAD